MGDYIIAVDVGTGSARAGVFDLDGEQLSRVVTPIALHQPAVHHYEQNSEDIWQAVARSVRQARRDAGLKAEEIAAIGFDATCSLVFRDVNGQPLSISSSGDAGLDTMLWMDHRAMEEADACSLPGHPVVKRYGGWLSPELQPPKLLWTKRNMPDQWRQAGLIFDLCDFLTWRATGSNTRSHSALASKWGYEPSAPGSCPQDYYSAIGLADLIERSGIPMSSAEPGGVVAKLTVAVAQELGLTEACVVSSGLIDAYAGASGAYCLAGSGTFERQAALVAGTSSCVVVLSDETIEPRRGCWGGFRDVSLRGLWLMEAGQSASGALLDFIVKSHPAGGTPEQALHLRIMSHISEKLQTEGYRYGSPISVLPDFHGTRAPLSEPGLTGTIAGMSMDDSFDGLCRLYWRACVGLACGIRNILEQLPHSEAIDTLLMTGGFSNHRLIAELYANATGREVRVTDGRDAVLVGTAVNAGLAAGLIAGYEDARLAFGSEGKSFRPSSQFQADLQCDYEIYHTMVRHREELSAIIAGGNVGQPNWKPATMSRFQGG